jgi:hypothetical protein
VSWRVDGRTTGSNWDLNLPTERDLSGPGGWGGLSQHDSYQRSTTGTMSAYGVIDPQLLVDWALQAANRASYNRPRPAYSAPRSGGTSRSSGSSGGSSSAGSTPGRMHDASLPATSFENMQSVGTNFSTESVGAGERLDTQAKVERYIRDRTSDPSFAPTAENLELLAKEVADRDGIIAIATHMGGTKQSDDAIILENGATIDLIGNVGSPDAKWQWLHHGKDFGSTYDPSRNVVDPKTGEFKTWGDFISGKGKPVPPYIPLPPGYGASAGKIDHVDAEWLMRRPQGQLYTDMPGLPASQLDDKTLDSSALTLGRWVQDQQMPPTTESLEAFVKLHPDFEMREGNQIRVKPEALHKYPNDPDAGEWRTVIADSGAGPAWDFTKTDAARAPDPFRAGGTSPFLTPFDVNTSGRIRA